MVCIVTPGTRTANNGNWRTAARWASMLRDRYKVIVQTGWDGNPVQAMVALHARRSAASIEEYCSRHGAHSLALILSGTDLYRDLPESATARRSLDLAGHIVMLQDDALEHLEMRWREKARVIFQSARPLATRSKAGERLTCIVVGHLRSEKDPETLFRAIDLLPPDAAITIRHLGAPLDKELAAAARALAKREPRYRYSGSLPHGLARSAIAAAHLLIHPSRMEGGANVIAEAITSGTPVLASRVSGNVGMLGADYPGYFAAGDASGLAASLVSTLQDPSRLRALKSACARRKALFQPTRERREVRQLIAELLA